MDAWNDTTDDRLLVESRRQPEAFAAFYRRYETSVLRFFLARTRDTALAVDLTAETFAGALVALGRFRPGGPPAEAWLFGIARNTLLMSLRRGRVEQQMRRRLGMQAIVVDDETLERVEALLDQGPMLALVDDLPHDQREALVARVIDERDYGEIARELECSEAVVRQRVSRALRTLRKETGGTKT